MTLEPTADEIREQVRQNWQSASTGWNKWERVFGHCAWPVTQKMLAVLAVRPGLRVLDIGCGVGDPALAQAVLPTGTVTAIDPAEGMIETARARARILELRNIRFQVGPIEAMDFAGARFDVVSARFSLMFLGDVAEGLSRIREVLMPNGRLAAATWMAHEVNPMFRIPADALAVAAPEFPVDPNAPGPMRFAKPGRLKAAMEEVGFEDVRVDEIPLYFFAPDLETYWRILMEMSGGMRSAMERMSADQQVRFKSHTLSAARRYLDSSGVLRLPARAILASGSRGSD